MNALSNPAWIGGRTFDLLFFFGSGVLAFAVGMLVLWMPALLIPFVWLWLWLVDGPHLIATWQRIVLDARERHTHTRLLASSFGAVAVAVALWAVSALSARPEPFELLLVGATFLSWHHLLRQHYGIMAIYEAQTRSPPRLWQLDRRLLQSALWIALFLSLVAMPANRNLFNIAWPLPLWARLFGIIGTSLMIAIVLTFVATIVWRVRHGLSVRPALFALLPVLGVSCFALFGVGAFEPVLLHPTNNEQIFLAATLVGGLVHGLQYIGIVSAANRRRYAGDESGSLAARIGKAPLIAYLLLVAVSGVYLLLNAARASMPGMALLPEENQWARFFVAVYWGLFFQHYYLDRKIWHIRSDPRLRDELNLGTSA